MYALVIQYKYKIQYNTKYKTNTKYKIAIYEMYALVATTLSLCIMRSSAPDIHCWHPKNIFWYLFDIDAYAYAHDDIDEHNYKTYIETSTVTGH